MTKTPGQCDFESNESTLFQRFCSSETERHIGIRETTRVQVDAMCPGRGLTYQT